MSKKKEAPKWGSIEQRLEKCAYDLNWEGLNGLQSTVGDLIEVVKMLAAYTQNLGSGAEADADAETRGRPYQR